MWLPQKGCEGEVQQEVAPWSYTVELDDGSTCHNHRDLVQLPNTEMSEVSQSSTSNTPELNPSQQSESNESSASPKVRRSNRISQPPN